MASQVTVKVDKEENQILPLAPLPRAPSVVV